MLYDNDPEGIRTQHASPVKTAQPPERARLKSAARVDGANRAQPDDLSGRSGHAVPQRDGVARQSRLFLTIATQPTQLQSRAFDLLGLDSAGMFPVRILIE